MIKPRKTISFNTLGCRLNQSETAVIEQTFLAGQGFHVVDFKEPADIVVINTCTVTENGDADTRGLVNKAVRTNPNARIALIGCQAQVQKDKLAELPNVKWVVGNAKKMELLDIFKEDSAPDTAQIITPTIARETFTIPLPGIDKRHTRANIKIQDGCDFFCSFCEIPYARGRARSREFQDILKEASALADAGHREIVVTGINVGTYQHNNYQIMDVIEALEQIPALDRIRISSIEPTTIPKALIDKMAQPGKLCRYLHIPLQSGSDDTLTAMKRKYTTDEFYDFINDAYQRVPDICIGTDVIVGFPSESDASFAQTEENLRSWPIHYFHVFRYSKRYMAKSRLEDDLSPKILQQRSAQLRDLSQRKRRLYHQSLLGNTESVLFEQKKHNLWTGLTDTYVRVFVESAADLQNQIRSVHFESLTDKGVIARLEETL